MLKKKIYTTYDKYTEVFLHNDINYIISIFDNFAKDITKKIDKLLLIELEKTKQIELTNIPEIEKTYYSF